MVSWIRCALLVLALPAVARADVKLAPLPKGGQVPDVALDTKGTLHVTYGHGLPGDGFYIRSTDLGQSWSAPVKLNDKARTVTTGMERGPKIALGRDGAIHVVWLGHYKLGGGVWYTRSTDGGKTFAKERNLVEPEYGVDNATVAADEAGNVIVLWTGGFPGVKEDRDSPAASPIILARSTDDGKSFSKNELLKSDHPVVGRACGCCRLEARIVGDQLVVGFRGGYKNLRDPYLLRGPKTGNKFTCQNVSPDKWEAGCPMQGIPFQVDAKGRVLLAWMNQDRAFFALAPELGEKFGPRLAAPEGKANQEFPLALGNGKGELILTWKEGQTVRWARFSAEGKQMGAAETLKLGPGRHKHAAFVDPKGNFVIVH